MPFLVLLHSSRLLFLKWIAEHDQVGPWFFFPLWKHFSFTWGSGYRVNEEDRLINWNDGKERKALLTHSRELVSHLNRLRLSRLPGSRVVLITICNYPRPVLLNFTNTTSAFISTGRKWLQMSPHNLITAHTLYMDLTHIKKTIVPLESTKIYYRTCTFFFGDTPHWISGRINPQWVQAFCPSAVLPKNINN